MVPDSSSRNTSARSAGTEVFLAFGASKGDREAFVRFAMDELEKGNFIIQMVSPCYETDPVDCEDGVPPFLNGVLQGVWNSSADELLEIRRDFPLGQENHRSDQRNVAAIQVAFR